MKEHKRFYMVIFSLLTVFFVLLIMAVFVLKKEQKEKVELTTIFTEQGEITQAAQETASFKLSTKEGETNYQVGELVTLLVAADSKGASITGYDVILNFDPKMVSFVEVKGRLDEFQVFSSTKDGKVFVSAIKKLNAKQESVFSETQLIGVNFKTTDTGEVNFTFDFIEGATNESNLIDEKSQDVLRQVEGMKVVID